MELMQTLKSSFQPLREESSLKNESPNERGKINTDDFSMSNKSAWELLNFIFYSTGSKSLAAKYGSENRFLQKK